MEFLTPKQKREKSRRLLLGYGLFGILILLATYIMVSTALGYEVFTTKGEVVQNGLLFVDSRPDGASVTINGRRESENTNVKLSLPEGTYDILLQKNGFRDWRHTVSLGGGTVEFLTYPRLLPNTPAKLSTTSYSGNKMDALQSRDKRWLLLRSSAEPTLLRLHDLDRPTADILTMTVPGDDVTELSEVELVEWAGDNVHLLVRVKTDSATKLYVFNREKTDEIIDVTSLFGLSGAVKGAFWDGKWDQLAIVESTGITRLARIKERALSATSLVAEPVVDFYPLSSQRAVYTTLASDGNLTVRVLEDEKTYQIISIPKSEKKLIVKGGGFNRNDYLMLSGGGLEKALLYRNVVESIKQSTTGRVSPFVTFPLEGTVLEFSRSNRFALAASVTENTVYDIEQKKMVRYKNPVQNMTQIGWFDDARLYSTTAEGTLSIYDFNGDNMYELTKSAASAPFVNQSVESSAVVLKGQSIQTVQVLDIVSESE